MKRFLIVTAAMAGIVAAADQQTFTGVITDTMCGRSHGMAAGTAGRQVRRHVHQRG
jgi:hypothetical protein